MAKERPDPGAPLRQRKSTRRDEEGVNRVDKLRNSHDLDCVISSFADAACRCQGWVVKRDLRGAHETTKEATPILCGGVKDFETQLPSRLGRGKTFRLATLRASWVRNIEVQVQVPARPGWELALQVLPSSPESSSTRTQLAPSTTAPSLGRLPFPPRQNNRYLYISFLG